MASIAYITDSKLLEYHRLNRSQKINFWRLSDAKFSDFKKGDLLFFLSKDKKYQKNKEKGIVGYGRCDSIHEASVNTIWKNFGNANGYSSLSNFKEAIIKVTKDKKLPKKISSIYLNDVVFFQDPIYLSDCGKSISKSVESYIYLDNDEFITLNILSSAKKVVDIWTSGLDAEDIIEKEEIRCVLYKIHETIGLNYPKAKSKKLMKDFLALNSDYSYIKDSKYEAYKIEEDRLYIINAPLLEKDEMMEKRIFLGQELLYKKMFDELYPYNLHIIFKVIEKGD